MNQPKPKRRTTHPLRRERRERALARRLGDVEQLKHLTKSPADRAHKRLTLDTVKHKLERAKADVANLQAKVGTRVAVTEDSE